MPGSVASGTHWTDLKYNLRELPLHCEIKSTKQPGLKFKENKLPKCHILNTVYGGENSTLPEVNQIYLKNSEM